MFTVREIAPHEAYPLRHKVLWPHIALQEECTIAGEAEEGVFHLATLVNTTVVSIGSFFPSCSPKLNIERQYRLRAMATDPAYRGQQTGTMLLHFAMERLKEKGEHVLWCDARIAAIPFYEKIGFSLLPEVYEIPIIGPHQFMWKIVSV